MTDKKFTDEEIVKALQQHLQDYDEELKHSPCEDCPVRRLKGGTCIDVMTRGALDIINRQKAEIEGYRKQSEGEWISVEERLPDCEYGAETEALLFRLKTGTVQAGYFGTGGKFRDKYFRCYHHANEGWDAKDVTHWMPLPEPPKGE